MEMRAVGGLFVAFSIAMILLAARCILQPPPGNDQTVTDACPRFPLEIVLPIHYQEAPVNGSETTITMFTST